MPNLNPVLIIAVAFLGYLIGQRLLLKHRAPKEEKPPGCPPHEWESGDVGLSCGKCKAIFPPK